ncbi:MAG: hypothetical protein NC324_01575 [Bacteroides sp.]|nr:hypothetical protein [Bacteroides sp.]
MNRFETGVKGTLFGKMFKKHSSFETGEFSVKEKRDKKVCGFYIRGIGKIRIFGRVY